MIAYDPHNWRDHLFDIRGSMVREILSRVVLGTAWSALVVAANRHGLALRMGLEVHTLIGVPLGLLLVFRTNASYDRFWEGRRLWGSIVNAARNLARMVHTATPEGSQLQRLWKAWIVAFPYAAMNSLRGRAGLGPAVADLPPHEVSAAVAAQHVPLFVAARLTAAAHEAHRQGLLTNELQLACEQLVQQLIDWFGGCERIHRTPLPFAYMVHLRRALILYCYTLPLGLVEKFGWLTVPCTLAVSYVFFGIEEIGVEIEDPFGEDDNDLPLDAICALIESNVLSLDPVAASSLAR